MEYRPISDDERVQIFFEKTRNQIKKKQITSSLLL